MSISRLLPSVIFSGCFTPAPKYKRLEKKPPNEGGRPSLGKCPRSRSPIRNDDSLLGISVTRQRQHRQWHVGRTSDYNPLPHDRRVSCVLDTVCDTKAYRGKRASREPAARSSTPIGAMHNFQPLRGNEGLRPSSVQNGASRKHWCDMKRSVPVGANRCRRYRFRGGSAPPRILTNLRLKNWPLTASGQSSLTPGERVQA